MLQVRAAGIRPGSSALGPPASGSALALESLGDSTPGSVASASSLAAESPGDSSSTAGSSDPFPEPRPDPPLDRESPGDSEASGDSEGDDGEPVGLACAEVDPPGLLPPLAEGLDDGDPPPPDGVAVGDEPVEDELGDEVGDDELGDEVGDEVGLGVDDGVGVAATGGATPGDTAPLFSRSCCHDRPTEPPAGTVRPPMPYDE
jgi:hypothetical protein